eukprot:SAG31_NODE_14985_length_777_cov_1.070796_1_plen_259_part_11
MIVDPLCLNEEEGQQAYLYVPSGSATASFKASLCITPHDLGKYMTDLIGLETIGSSYPSFKSACLLFAWMILVTELQKSRAYARMRLHVKRDRKLGLVRSWLSFAKRLKERKTAIKKIDTSLHRLNNTLERLRQRRGSISRWHKVRKYTLGAKQTGEFLKERKRYIQLQVDVVEAKNLQRGADGFVRLTLEGEGNVSNRESTRIHETAVAKLCTLDGSNALKFDQSFTFVMGTSRRLMPQTLRVHVVCAHSDEKRIEDS